MCDSASDNIKTRHEEPRVFAMKARSMQSALQSPVPRPVNHCAHSCGHPAPPIDALPRPTAQPHVRDPMSSTWNCTHHEPNQSIKLRTARSINGAGEAVTRRARRPATPQQENAATQRARVAAEDEAVYLHSHRPFFAPLRQIGQSQSCKDVGSGLKREAVAPSRGR